MDKKTKIVLGVAAIGVAGYLYYQSTQPKKTGFANASGNKKKKKKMNITGTGIDIHATGGKLFEPTANNKVFNNITGTGIDIHASGGKFSNMSGGMHMMPDGSMMENSMMMSGGMANFNQTKSRVGGIFIPTKDTSVFNS